MRFLVDESGSVSTGRQLKRPVKCSDNRNMARDAVVPAAR